MESIDWELKTLKEVKDIWDLVFEDRFIDASAKLQDKLFAATEEIETTTKAETPQAEIESLDRFIREMEKILTWLKEGSFADVLEDCTAPFHDYMTKVAQPLSFVIPETFFDERHTGLLCKLWIIWAHSLRAAQKVRLWFLNSYRKLLKKPPIPPSLFQRRFRPEGVIHHHLVYPLGVFWIGQWREFLLASAKILNQKEEQLIGFWEPLPQNEKAPESGQLLKELVAQIKSSFVEFETEAKSKAEKYWTELSKEFSKKSPWYGTWTIPGFTLSKAKAHKKFSKLIEKHREPERRWKRYWDFSKAEWNKELSLQRLKLGIEFACREGKLSLQSLWEDLYATEFHKIQVQLVELDAEELNRMLRNQNFEGLRKILSQRIESLDQKHLPRLQEVLTQKEPRRVMRRIIKQVSESLDRLPQNQAILYEHQLVDPPKTALKQIGLKKIIEIEIFGPMQDKIDKSLEKLESQNPLWLRDVAELDQLVEINLVTVLNAVESGDQSLDETPANWIAESKERIVGKLDDIGQAVKFSVEEAITDIMAQAGESTKAIGSLQDNDKILRLQIQLARSGLKKKVLGYWKGFFKGTKNLLPLLLKGASKTILKVGLIKQKLARQLGFVELEGEKTGIRFQLLEKSFQQRFLDLPPVYKFLFRNQPLEQHSLFSGRQTETEELQSACKAWRENQTGKLALVCNLGDGLSSLINQSMENLGFDQIIHLRFEKRCADFGDLGKEFQKAGISANDWQGLKAGLLKNHKSAIVVENPEALFFRSIQEKDLFQAFFDLQNETQDKLFWINGFSRMSWNFLEKSHSINRHFSQIIRIKPFTSAELKQALLLRHRLSGYHIDFNIPENWQPPRKIKKASTENERQELLKQHFFDNLYINSGGNLSSALGLWSRSTDSVEGEQLKLDPSARLETDHFQQLSLQDLFLMVSLLLHRSLNAQDCVNLFGGSLQEQEAALERLKEFGLVEHYQGHSRANRLYANPVINYLSSRNILGWGGK